MTTAFTFPGQGSQTVGMGKELADAFPEAREVFAEVDDALGEKLSTGCFSVADLFGSRLFGAGHCGTVNIAGRLLAGRILDAEEALALRLINEIAQPDKLLEVGNGWADRITRQAGLAVRLTKAAFHAPRDAHPYLDDLTQAVLFETDEKQARMTAFLERNKK